RAQDRRAARGDFQPALPERDAAAPEPPVDSRAAAGHRAPQDDFGGAPDGRSQARRSRGAQGVTQEGKGRGRRKVMTGTVVSAAMQKTVVAKIERLVKDQDYGKYVRRRSRFKIHDEKNECKVGDVIRFMETRPLSKDKCWRLLDFVKRVER